jgi:hypothetical protein
MQYDNPDMDFYSLHPKLQDGIYRAMEEAELAFNLKTKVPMTWIEDVHMEKSKSSGFPYFQRKGDIAEEITLDARRYWHFMKNREFNKLDLPPCTMGMRGHLSPKDEPKTRLVWMYPAAITQIEGVYLEKIIEAFVDLGIFESPLLVGKHGLARQAWLSSKITAQSIGLGLDQKSYDSTLPTFLITWAANVLAKNIEFNLMIDKSGTVMELSPRDARRCRHAYDMLIQYFINTPILLPNGSVYKKHKGVPSGSMFTNIIESVMTRALVIFALDFQGVRWWVILTNGDDSAAVLSHNQEPPNLDLIAELWKKCFGVILSKDKCVIARSPDEMHMSGSYWKGCYQWRSSRDLMMLALYCESFVKDQEVSLSRMLGLWIAGGYRDEQFCSFFTYYQTCFPFNYKSKNILQHLGWMNKAYKIKIKQKDLPLNMFKILNLVE